MSNEIWLFACAKNEDRYLKEWLDYHFNLGFDRIWLNDNNDDTHLLEEDYIKQYIENGKLIYVDATQQELANLYHFCEYIDEFIVTHKNEYGWCGFIDIDEFVTLGEQYENIHDYLDNCDWCDILKINDVVYDWNYQQFYEDKPVLERFTRICMAQKSPYNDHFSSYLCKTFLRGGIDASFIRPEEVQFQWCKNNNHTPYAPQARYGST